MARLRDELRRLGATDPEAARSFSPTDEQQATALKYLVESRIVVQPRPGVYFLDLEAEARQRKARGSCLAILLTTLAIGLLLFFGAFAWLAAMIAT